MPAFFIQGLLFETNPAVDPSTRKTKGDSLVMKKGVISGMFSGVIWKDPKTDRFQGEMIDSDGEATLSEIAFGDSFFSFIKRYKKSREQIVFSFKVQRDNQWFGEFHGKSIGQGQVTCLLISLKDQAFDPLFVENLLAAVSPKGSPSQTRQTPQNEREILIRGSRTGLSCPAGYEYCWQCGHVDWPEVFLAGNRCPNPSCPHPTLWDD